MLILAADTSGKQGSIALARGQDNGACHAIEVVALEGGTFSAQLVPQIAALLSKHGVRNQDIGAFVVVSGPGSFTGLRVGLAAIKGLAEIVGKPIAAVSLLEAVSMVAPSDGRILALLDAGRGEAYAGHYELQAGRAKVIEERLVNLKGGGMTFDDSILVTPDRSIAELLRARALPVIEVGPQHSDAIACIGWKKILAGEIVSPEKLEANYMRRSDAEIFSRINS